MKLSIGYQLPEGEADTFLQIVRDFRHHVSEVYFAWGEMPSGRAPMTSRRGYTDWAAQARVESDLRAFRALGVKLDLLLNANCYGAYAVSQRLEGQVISLLDHLREVVEGVEAVTTTSPAIARTVKRNFPEIEVRASVNMRIGTIKGMEYLSDLFDGYCVQRECNRDLAHLRELSDWAEENRKQLYLLVNSGCLNFCSGQTFHDNMVAHERELDEVANIPGWTPHLCWRYFGDRSHWPAALQNSWVRPEDLHHYHGLFHTVKLATRMHSRPRLVVQAYAERKHRGNLLDLFEPGLAPAFHPYIIDNERFPADWFERTARCDRRCHRCGYCQEVLDRVLTPVEAEAEALGIE